MKVRSRNALETMRRGKEEWPNERGGEHNERNVAEQKLETCQSNMGEKSLNVSRSCVTLFISSLGAARPQATLQK